MFLLAGIRLLVLSSRVPPPSYPMSQLSSQSADTADEAKIDKVSYGSSFVVSRDTPDLTGIKPIGSVVTRPIPTGSASLLASSKEAWLLGIRLSGTVDTLPNQSKQDFIDVLIGLNLIRNIPTSHELRVFYDKQKDRLALTQLDAVHLYTLAGRITKDKGYQFDVNQAYEKVKILPGERLYISLALSSVPLSTHADDPVEIAFSYQLQYIVEYL